MWSTVKPPSTACATTPSGSSPRQPGKVTAKRPAREREDGRDHSDDPDRIRHGAVAELDERVRAASGQRNAAAVRPVLAHEPDSVSRPGTPVIAISVSDARVT